MGMDQESVEERLSSWRKQQQFKFENQSPLDAANPRDDDGRMKLLASVSKGSISLFFFILMWRSVHHYELADQSFKGKVRLIMVFPTICVFLFNMIGCVASLMSSSTNASRNAKKRMKAVLNLNKLVELCLIFYNVMRLIFFPSKYVMREIYVSRTLTNFLFIIQCQLFTKVTWGAAQINPSGMLGSDGSYQSSTNIDENSENENAYEGGYNEAYPASSQQQQQQPPPQQQQQQTYNNYDESGKGQW